MQGGQDKSLGRRDTGIFLVSVAILFLELVLIRWIGTEIRIFAYFGNLLLVVCFFGMGVGCYLASRPLSLVKLGVNLLLLVALVVNPFRRSWLDFRMVTMLLSGFEDSLIWEQMAGWTGWHLFTGLAMVGVLLYVLMYVFVPLGQLLGRAFAAHPRTIRAYSMNIAGSLAGVWLFNSLSWMSTPPAVWFGVVAVLTATLGDARGKWWATVGALMAALVATQSQTAGHARTLWSPYQKLIVTPFVATAGTNQVAQGYTVEVNGILHQQMLDLSDRFAAAHREVFDSELMRLNHYNLPFAFKPAVQRLLVVGAGTGNNAAAALRHGVERVDCVDIDPMICRLGRQFHPEHPYESPRVRLFVDDARAFFKQANGPYDMIWFGLLDSHTLGSAFNNLRLDHFVYTRESLAEANRLLADNGLLVLSFGAQRGWIADRLVRLTREVFGAEPLVFFEPHGEEKYGYGGGVTLICGRQAVTLDNVQDPAVRAYIQERRVDYPGTTRPTTDDWPYLYLPRARIPMLHVVTSLTILATMALAQRRVLGVGSDFDWHFFALGAAFLLLEVQTVSRAMLLFGMTWIVNAIVISAVLVMILLANLVAARWPRFPQWATVAGLAATVAALALVPLDWFNTLTGVTKLLAASAFLTAPVLFAGLIFIRSFAACGDKARALGSNLIGALVGGLLESLSFVTGIRALVLVVGLFYAIALLTRPRLMQNLPTAD
jgi:SAM-dependent methyltransferase